MIIQRTTPAVGPAPHAARAAAALADLVLPVSCAGCGEPGARVCHGCRRALQGCLYPDGAGAVHPHRAPAGLPPCHAAGVYLDVLATLVVAYKDGDRRDLAADLGDLLGVALDHALTTSGTVPTLAAARAAPVLVVPAPSSRAALRRRGDVPLHALAARAVRGYGAHEVRWAPVLAHRRGGRSQKSLGVVGRATNLHGAVRVRPSFRPVVAGSVCVLVDDVVTTGATLAAAALAVRAAGGTVAAAATVCATVLRDV